MPKKIKGGLPTLQDVMMKLDTVANAVVTTVDSVDDLAVSVKEGFDEMGRRFDRLERVVLPNHRSRIEHLEVDMQHVKDTFLIK